MRLIGAGMPRTGTLTQKVALETLGFEPCYHWVNVIADLDQVDVWNRALDGDDPWDEVFGDSQATVDWPGGYFWRELMDLYPDAKVLLSVRDPEKWEPSFRETIWNMCYGESLIRLLSSARAQVDPRWARYLKLVERMFWIEAGAICRRARAPRAADRRVQAPQRGSQGDRAARAVARVERERRLGAFVRVPRGPDAR